MSNKDKNQTHYNKRKLEVSKTSLETKEKPPEAFQNSFRPIIQFSFKL